MTDLLFANPSVLSGIASCVDLFGIYTTYNNSSNEYNADKRALMSDIATIKNDFENAFYGVINEK